VAPSLLRSTHPHMAKSCKLDPPLKLKSKKLSDALDWDSVQYPCACPCAACVVTTDQELEL